MRVRRAAIIALMSVVGVVGIVVGGTAHAWLPLPIACGPNEVAVVANLHNGGTWFQLDDQYITQETSVCRPFGTTIHLHAPVGQFDWATAADAPGKVFDRDVPDFRVDRDLLIVAVFRDPQPWEASSCYVPA